MTEPTGLVKWSELRLPGTCQTMTDVDEATGELLVTIWGEPPAPPPPSDVLNGSVVAGRVVFRASEKRCLLFDVELEPV